MTHLSAEGRNNGVTILSLDGYQWLVEWIDRCTGEHLATLDNLVMLRPWV